MKASHTPSNPSNALLNAATDAARTGNESAVATAFAILRRRHRARPDIRAKLLELADRKLGAAK